MRFCQQLSPWNAPVYTPYASLHSFSHSTTSDIIHDKSALYALGLISIFTNHFAQDSLTHSHSLSNHLHFSLTYFSHNAIKSLVCTNGLKYLPSVPAFRLYWSQLIKCQSLLGKAVTSSTCEHRNESSSSLNHCKTKPFPTSSVSRVTTPPGSGKGFNFILSSRSLSSLTSSIFGLSLSKFDMIL